MRAGDAQLAKFALGFLAKPGADGRSRLEAPVRLQDGQLFFGAARLLRLPRLVWE